MSSLKVQGLGWELDHNDIKHQIKLPQRKSNILINNIKQNYLKKIGRKIHDILRKNNEKRFVLFR